MTGDPTTGVPVPEVAATGIPRQASPPAAPPPERRAGAAPPPDGSPADHPSDEEPEEQPDGASPAEPEAAPPPGGPPRLGERERRILAFERRWWRHAGAKEQAIRDAFGLSATRYYQLLNALLDDPGAQAHDPVLVGRLRRLRAARSRSRRR
jgi:hypothetical protein